MSKEPRREPTDSVPRVTRLLLVRHGQSVWNASGRWQGQANPPLSQLGHAQAEDAAAGVAAVDSIASSDLVRAHQTAMVLQAAAGVLSLTVDARLRERRAGEWQGLTRNQIDDRYPGYLEDGRRPPGWESGEELEHRVMKALAELAVSHDGGTCMVVTHAGVIYTIESAHGLPQKRIANLGGRWLEIDGRDTTLGERVDLVGTGVETTIPDQI